MSSTTDRSCTKVESMQGRVRQHYLTLDAARGVAALAVLLLHIGLKLQLVFFPAGYLAVDFFFALSGFVVACAYEDRLLDGMGFAEFAAVRCRRLWPLYMAGTAIGLLYQLGRFVAGDYHIGVADLALSSALALLMFPGPGAPDVYALNPPAWSLGFELAINGVYAGCVRWLKTPVALVLAGIALLGVVYSNWRFGSMDAGPRWADVFGGFPRVTFSFLVGVMIYRGRRGKSLKEANITPALILLALGVIFAVAPRESWSNVAIVAFVFPALIYAGSLFQPTGWLARVGKLAGPWSYALYAVHIPVLDLIWGKLRHTHYPKPLMGLWMFIAAALAALAANYLLDVPAQKFLRRKPLPQQAVE